MLSCLKLPEWLLLVRKNPKLFSCDVMFQNWRRKTAGLTFAFKKKTSGTVSSLVPRPILHQRVCSSSVWRFALSTHEKQLQDTPSSKIIPPIILYSACLVTAAVTWKFSHLSHTLSPVATGHGKCMNLSQTISKNHWLLGTGYEWSWTWDCWLSRSIKHGQNPSRSCRSPVSTRMLLLQRSNSQLLLSLDLEDMNGHGHGIAGCLDLSNTAKIQAGVAGHQFQPECYCYSGRTASCYWVWTKSSSRNKRVMLSANWRRIDLRTALSTVYQ